MTNITVEGFTPLERELADRMWALESPEEVAAFILSLPRSLRAAALTVREMLVVAYIDSVVAEMPQFTEAEELVDRFRV